jgi:hypothetical protein
MTFEEKIKAAGFIRKSAFARHYGVHPVTVSRWGENPPKWATQALEDRIRIREALKL